MTPGVLRKPKVKDEVAHKPYAQENVIDVVKRGVLVLPPTQVGGPRVIRLGHVKQAGVDRKKCVNCHEVLTCGWQSSVICAAGSLHCVVRGLEL